MAAHFLSGRGLPLGIGQAVEVGYICVGKGEIHRGILPDILRMHRLGQGQDILLQHIPDADLGQADAVFGRDGCNLRIFPRAAWR